MRTAEAIKIINDKLGAEITEALTCYIDDFKEDKISLLREENRNLHLETKSDLEKQILQVRIDFHRDIRSQTVWIISSMFAIAALMMGALKFL